MAAKAQSYKIRIQDFEGDDIRAFYETNVMRVWNLNGREQCYRIVRVQQIVKQEGAEVEKRAALRLADRHGVEFPVPLELNPTNRDTIRGIYGDKARNWIGKVIALYPTQCEAFGKMQDCIRIRPYDPTKRQKRPNVSQLEPAAPPRREPSRPPPADEAPASSGLELDLDDDRPVYRDSTEDNEEPPPGALYTDSAMEIIR